jgi:hypothetical protein
VDAEAHQIVTLSRTVVDEMLAHVQAGYPNEACGVLAGLNGQVVKNYPTANAAEQPDDFSIIGSEDATNGATSPTTIHIRRARRTPPRAILTMRATGRAATTSSSRCEIVPILRYASSASSRTAA